jgi:hypothetical protein
MKLASALFPTLLVWSGPVIVPIRGDFGFSSDAPPQVLWDSQ